MRELPCLVPGLSSGKRQSAPQSLEPGFFSQGRVRSCGFHRAEVLRARREKFSAKARLLVLFGNSPRPGRAGTSNRKMQAFNSLAGLGRAFRNHIPIASHAAGSSVQTFGAALRASRFRNFASRFLRRALRSRKLAARFSAKETLRPPCGCSPLERRGSDSGLENSYFPRIGAPASVTNLFLRESGNSRPRAARFRERRTSAQLLASGRSATEERETRFRERTELFAGSVPISDLHKHQTAEH